MEALVLTGIAAAAAAAFAWPRWRLSRVLARPMPAEWEAILTRNLPAWRRMPPALQAQMRRLVTQFLHQKKFIGCDGLEVTDEMRVTVAGWACLLLLNRPSRVYGGLDHILLYPGEFLVPNTQPDMAGVVTEDAREGLLGQSWSDGRVILSWDHVLEAVAGQASHNVVLHEFAHQLDSEDGNTNGAPYLGHPESYKTWSEVLMRDYERLRQQAFFGGEGVLDTYGASSPAEFFAVATEAFFCRPHELAERHGELYAEFMKYYRVDPREWTEPPRAAPVAGYGFAYGQWQ